MSQNTPSWQWDSTARQWYIHDLRSGSYIYEDGSRRDSRPSQPRNIPSSARGYVSAGQTFTSPPARTAALGDVASTNISASRAPAPSAIQRADRRRPERRNDRVAQSQDPLARDFATSSLGSASPPSSQNETQAWTASDGNRYLEVQNTHSQVRTIVQLGPPNKTTDPALFAQGIKATQMLLSTDGEAEKLFDNFRRRAHPTRFFTRGKVFWLLWSEPAGDTQNDITQTTAAVTVGRYGERVFSKVRLFVVILEGRTYCSALPILTYGDRGVAKTGVTKSEHALVYSGRIPPEIMTKSQCLESRA